VLLIVQLNHFILLKGRYMNAIINNTNTSFVPSEKAVVLIEEFKNHARKTAESILEMGKVVYEAKKLADYEFGYFCAKIGFERTSPTIRKFVQIGQKYELLISKSKSLPSNWTTIYDVALLGNELIEEYVNDGSINQATTGKEVKVLLGKEKNINEKTTNAKSEESFVQNGTQVGYGFKVMLDGAPSKALVKKLTRIFAELKELQLEYELAPSLEEFMNNDLAEAA